MNELVVIEPVGLQLSDLESAKVGGRIDTHFGEQPAQLMCVEKLTAPTLFLRFRLMVFGIEVAELSAERDQSGSWTLEEL